MKRTKTKLVSSIVTLLICFAMLIGSTFAWFTDSASTGVNTIQAGNLDVVLEMNNGTAENPSWVNAEGKTLTFKTKDNRATDKILWEPGCTYELPELRIVNKGNLNLKYKIEVTGVTSVNGVAANNKLLEVIDFTYGNGININDEVTLAPGAKTEGIVLKGHMKKEAGNEYKGLSIDGISITVYAKQATGEYDSFNNIYDNNANYVKRTATIMGDNGETITLEAGERYNIGNATVSVDDSGNISYTNTSGPRQTVTITTDGGTLTVNAPNDTVKHYGSSDMVNITAIAGNSFHEFGKVCVLSVASGRVVAENGNNIDIIQVKGNSAVVAVPENKTLETKLEKATEVSNITLKVINSTGAEVASKTTADGKVTDSIPEELKEVLSTSNSTIEEAIDYVARVKNNYYDTLDAAINAAGIDDTITLLKDSVGKGIGSLDASQTTTRRNSLTIDFNGHTYTMNDPAVGSSGTETQAMHWGGSLGAVTLKNGTFKVAEDTEQVTMAMQNYINFTAENMTFDFTTIPVYHYGNNFTGADAVYNNLEIPLFNNGNGGTMVLRNCTISMPESSVKGISNDGHEIMIDSCTINGAVVMESANKVVKVKNSVITKGVSPYFNSGYTVKTSEKDGYTVYTNQIVVNISNTEQLTDAINQNSEVTVKLTNAGTYDLPQMTDKEVSIIGTKDTVIDMRNKLNNNAKSISFEGVTVNFGTKDFYGFQHTGKLTYRDCKITGKQFLYADEVEFNNCVFEQNIVDYNVWTYGAGNVLFKDCTFNCAGKSVLIYNEGSINGQTVEFKNCKFNATAQADGKAAIEIDSSLLKNGIYTVIIDQATANSVSGFGTGSVSNSSVWNNKKGDKATVIVAGNTVLSASSAS